MPKPDITLPLLMIRISLRRSNPVRALFTKIKPSLKGLPILLVNSSGAAPVPPSPPSTVMKSGLIPVSCIALQMARNSRRLPTQSLKPIGLPPDFSRSNWTNSINSKGVENAECPGGELTSCPIGTPRISAISLVSLAAGRIPPCPGFAPWESLISIIFTWSWDAFSANFSALKLPSLLRQAK